MDKKILILGKSGRLATAFNKIFCDLKPLAMGEDELNLLNLTKAAELILNLKPSIIINCTAVTDVDACETNFEVKLKAYKLNGQAPGFLANLCKKMNSILIHFSTDYVFDGKNSKPYTESDKPNPINIYGKTKLLGEQLIREVYDKHYIIRTSWLWGEGRNFISWFLEQLKTKNEINLVADQLGKPTNVYDLVRHVRLILENDSEFGIYHLVNEETGSWFKIGSFIYEHLKKNTGFGKEVKLNKIKLSDLKRPAARPLNSVLANTRFHKMRPWKEAMIEHLNHIQNSFIKLVPKQ